MTNTSISPPNALRINYTAENNSAGLFPQVSVGKKLEENEKKSLKEDDETNEDNSKSKLKRKKKFFTKEEDDIIKEMVAKHGTKKWSVIAEYVKGRTPKQCRDRYCNYLFPGVFKGEWSKQDDELLITLYDKLGPRWAILQRSFPYRSVNDIKNHWEFFLCRQNNNNNNSTESEPTNKNENTEKYCDNHETVETHSIHERASNSLGTKNKESSNIFDNIPNDELSDYNIFEFTNDWYESFI